MIKSKIALLALASVCAGLAVVGCSGEGTVDSSEVEGADFQKVKFNLSVGGADVQTVNFSVTKSDGSVIKAGSLEVPGGDSSFSAQLLLPVGTGYTLAITGTGSNEGRSVPCAGSQTFNVIAGSNPPVNVAVVCTDSVQAGNTKPNTGSVQANVSFTLDTVIEPGEECGFTHAVVAPLVQQVGSKIDLKSQYVGTDAEASWSATDVVGVFADASADDTTFTCGAVSEGSIKASLTAAKGCVDSFEVAVKCIGTAVCGDGARNQASEQCDDGNTAVDDGCSDTCQIEAVVCGDGDVDAPETCDDGNVVGGDNCSATCALEGCGNGTPDVGEECDDGNNTNNDACSATCRIERCGDAIQQSSEACDDGNQANGDGCENDCTISAICGNGVVQAASGEECDDGGNANNDGCSASCKVERCGDAVVQTGENCQNCATDVIASGGSCQTCGNGAVEGTEECDDGNVVDGDGCSAACEEEEDTRTACDLCLSANPDTGGYNDGQCNVDPLCAAVRDCIADTACYIPTAGSQECLCGMSVSNPGAKADVAECGNPTFAPNGPCSAAIKAGLPADSTNVQLLERQFDFNYPGGIGFGLLAFARDAEICLNECNMQ